MTLTSFIETTFSFSPEIIEEPNPMQVKLFNSAEFTCSATGQPTPTYRWFKDGTELKGRFDSRLSFDQVQLSDRGFYVCQAYNSIGEKRSKEALLNVIGTCVFNSAPSPYSLATMYAVFPINR